MSTLELHSEPKRLWSWLWDSHITPNNSKWLQENLTEMDDKVRAMIKIINEDADSFARRAEMYYKKRPELMRLIENLYRAYRALAERHNQMIVELRLAHRTIPEAFPNQVNSMVGDDHIPSSTSETFLHVSLSPQLARLAFLCPDEFDSGISRKGLKQLVEMFQMVDVDSISEQCSCLSGDESLSCNAEDRCAQLENLNQLLRFEANDLIQRIAEKDQELLQNLTEVEEIRNKNLRLEKISFQEKAEREALLMKVEYMEEKSCILEGHLYDLHIELESFKEMMKTMQEENATIQEENKCLQDNLSKSEEEKCILLEEALSFEFQSAIFSNFFAQEALEKEIIIEELHCLRETYTDIEIELAVIEIEKMHLSELNDQYLSELYGYKCDLKISEDVAESCYYDLQVCSVRESLFESKVHELSGLCKILEDLGVRGCIEIEKMNGKISFLETKNKELDDKLAAYAHVASLEVHLTSTSKHQAFNVNDINEVHPPTTNDITSSMQDGLTKLNPGINLQPLEVIRDEESSWSMTGTPEIMDETRVKDTLNDHVSDYSSSSNQRSCGSEEPEVSKKVTELNEVETGKVIIERLSSDAQELERLNHSVQELKSKINTNKKSNLTKAGGQLQNIEASIAELMDVNTKLRNTIKDLSTLSCVDSFAQARSRITRQARKGAERIGRLQVDVQNIQYLLLRLEDEEKENNESLRNRKGVSLSDLLYSHGSKRRKQRKLHICGCDTKGVLDPSIKKFVKQDNKLKGMQTNQFW